MAQTEIERQFAFIAFWAASRATPSKAKGQNILRSALLFSHWIGAQVASRSIPKRSGVGASVALSSNPAAKVYPIITPLRRALSGASQRGHLYFAN
jgi:hypothetical protein